MHTDKYTSERIELKEKWSDRITIEKINWNRLPTSWMNVFVRLKFRRSLFSFLFLSAWTTAIKCFYVECCLFAVSLASHFVTIKSTMLQVFWRQTAQIIACIRSLNMYAADLLETISVLLPIRSKWNSVLFACTLFAIACNCAKYKLHHPMRVVHFTRVSKLKLNLFINSSLWHVINKQWTLQPWLSRLHAIIITYQESERNKERNRKR